MYLSSPEEFSTTKSTWWATWLNQSSGPRALHYVATRRIMSWTTPCSSWWAPWWCGWWRAPGV
jgi:hypothetical protein